MGRWAKQTFNLSWYYSYLNPSSLRSWERQFSSEADFEVIKHQMMFSEGLLVYLQNVNLEEKTGCCILQNCGLIAGAITGHHSAQTSCAATLSKVPKYLGVWVGTSVSCFGWSCDFSRETSNSAIAMVKLFFNCQSHSISTSMSWQMR